MQHPNNDNHVPSAGRSSKQQHHKLLSVGDALSYLDSHVNLEAIEKGRAGRAGEPTLSRINAILDAMARPDDGYPILQVTGTNGKGSTTRIASAILMGLGLCTGTYMSPHLELINERIAVNNQSITDDDLANILSSLSYLETFLLSSGKLEIPPTWFELMTAAAFIFFGDMAVDAAVVEVGMGGRYDATNAGDALVSVLTNVELDHVEILGPTKKHIALEKVGIVKPGSIFVQGERDPVLSELLETTAFEQGASEVLIRGRDFDCTSAEVAHGGRLLDIYTKFSSYESLFLPLHGRHQGDNAAIAITAVEQLIGQAIDQEVLQEALQEAEVPGRLEVLGRSPLVLLDGAHNEAGMSILAEALEEDFPLFENIIVIMGLLSGREPKKMLQALNLHKLALRNNAAADNSQPTNITVVACTPPSLRALPGYLVKEAAEELGLPSFDSGDVASALEWAKQAGGQNDIILITGSLYVVGSARQLF